MIHIATDPGLHRAFDLVAWGAGIGLGFALHRLKLVRSAAVRFGPGYFNALLIGAVVGAYLIGSLPALLRGEGAIGHSVAGALAGAIVAVELYKFARGIKESTGGALVGPFTLGIVIGRWGCLFAGLPDATFGTPTHLPWAVDLGDGIGRHPVQIYESLTMLVFLGVYLAGLVRGWPLMRDNGFHVMVVVYAIQRFGWEFLKPNPSVLGPLNSFHFVCLGLAIYGFVFIYRQRRSRAEPA